jgi:Tfp pilus assembly protein PilP
MSKLCFLAAFAIGLLAVSHARAQGGYSFNPLGVKRDPFVPPEVAKKAVGELNRYDINEMTLVAIMTGLGPAQAMIVLPNNSTHIVQTGDSIGRRNGRVARITANEVIIKESFRDYQNREKESQTSLVLAN